MTLIFIFENKVIEMNHKIGSDPIHLTLACKVFYHLRKMFLRINFNLVRRRKPSTNMTTPIATAMIILCLFLSADDAGPVDLSLSSFFSFLRIL